MEKFNWKDINFDKIGEGLKELPSLVAKNTQTKAQKISIEQQLEMNKENFKRNIINNSRELVKSLTTIQSSETRRGIISNGGLQEDLSKQVERQERLLEQEMMITERNLLFAKAIEEATAKNNRMNALSSIGTSVFSGLSDIFLPSAINGDE